ncbi:hypothetical protein L6164_023860 [Bauhinia variegata]|uniref:Uncharacterized protein n=1 Tax=Bauhinia variegata TaxID=167791 RepID=A0ACB9MJZ2_BAUVA|nr:hypothetical protein L6164_023860 [Bauhinia variegata]
MNRGTIKKNKLSGRSPKGQSGIARNSRVKKVHKNNHGAIQVDVPSVAKNSTSLKSATEVPPSTFQFYVSSDEGIHLYVDLNSCPSDFTNRFRSEFNITEVFYRKGSKSLWQDLGCLGEGSTKSSFLWNANSSQNDNHNGQIKTFPSLKVTRDDLVRIDQQEEGGNSSISALLIPSSNAANEADNLKKGKFTVSPELAANVAEHLKEGQSMVSVEVSCGVPNHYVSADESCAKDGTKEILDSGVTNTPLIKTLRGSVVNSVSNPDILENQNSNPDNEISEDFTLPNNSCIVNPGVECPGASEIGSMELQSSDVASCHKHASVSLGENDVSFDLVDQKHTSDTGQGRLVNSSELNLVTDGNSFQSLTEEWV